MTSPRVALAMLLIYVVAAIWIVFLTAVVVLSVLATRIAIFFAGYFFATWWKT